LGGDYRIFENEINFDVTNFHNFSDFPLEFFEESKNCTNVSIEIESCFVCVLKFLASFCYTDSRG
jgi:hypothetical protein